MREPFKPRPFLLRDERVRETLINAVRNLPADAMYPLEVVIREPVKGRKLSQNAVMWAGVLRDISEQGWVLGRRHSAEVWAEFFKRELLPEDFNPEMCKEGYRKWDVDPGGERVLIGSTTQLTVKGFSEYLTAMEAYGAGLGVSFTASPNER